MELDKIKDLLDNCGIKYKETNDYIITFWNIKNESIPIIIFIESETNWVMSFSIIQKHIKKEDISEVFKILLRINNRHHGVKYSLNFKEEISIISEFPLKYLDESILKSNLTEIVKSINELYDEAKNFLF